MYITKVSGHRQATMAVQRALKQMDPNIEAPTVNGFGYTYPRLERVINSAYMSVIKTTPKVWDYLYDNPNIVKKSKRIKDFLHKTSHEKIGLLIKKYRPDTVICTQAFPCGMVADYKRAHHADFQVIGVLTDYAPHSFWINEGVDYYIVPSNEAKQRFITKGVKEDAIKVYGIPIRSKFSVQLDKEPIMQRLGLEKNVPVILIMGGGQGLGPIKDVVKSLMKLTAPLQIIVLTGVNKKLLKWLGKQQTKKRKRATAKNKKLIFYEYANNVDELMEVSTLIVTKPGGMTTSECLAKGLPMVIVNPLPGQEMRNTDFLLKKGIAVRIDKTLDIGEEIDLLLRSSDKIADMRKAAYAEAHPHAALDIARLILDEKLDRE